MCGSNNQTPGTHPNANGGLIAGYNNNVKLVEGAAVCLGGNNVVYGYNQIFIGYDNYAQNSYSPKSICVGRGLLVDFSDLNQKVVLGTYNAGTATLTSEKKKLQTLIGGGDDSYIDHRHNAMEVYYGLNGPKCCVLFPEQFALSNYTTSNKAYVNAIDPPQDPTNPTTNEQTLATLGTIQALKDAINNAHLQRRELLLTGQLTQLTTGTAYNLESTFNITIPSWTRRIRIGYQISTFGTTQNFIEFGTVSGTFSTFSINDGTGTLFGVNLSYDSANKSITVNRVMSLTSSDDDWTKNTNTFGLISITAYGNFSF